VVVAMSDGTVHLPVPTFGLPVRTAPAPLRLDLEVDGRTATVWLIDVGLACCSVELMAAAMAALGSREAGALLTDPQAHADLLVVAGTCTDVMAPSLLRIYDAMPEPKRVVSFGACANSGGPYWDSYSVTKGIDQLIPVDLYVPGCPPRPEALLAGIAQLQETAAASGARPVAP
jgi:NADH-quinone oxidoreductase subunit B